MTTPSPAYAKSVATCASSEVLSRPLRERARTGCRAAVGLMCLFASGCLFHYDGAPHGHDGGDAASADGGRRDAETPEDDASTPEEDGAADAAPAQDAGVLDAVVDTQDAEPEAEVPADGGVPTLQGTLRVTVLGEGNGAIIGWISGDPVINCELQGGDCVATAPVGTEVYLNQTAWAYGGTTWAWGGACTGAGGTGAPGNCMVTLTEAEIHVTLTLTSIGVTLNLTMDDYATAEGVTGYPSATVTSTPPGLDCTLQRSTDHSDGTANTTSCSANFPVGTRVTLSYSTGSNTQFVVWEEPISSSREPTLEVAWDDLADFTSYTRYVTAKFAVVPTPEEPLDAGPGSSDAGVEAGPINDGGETQQPSDLQIAAADRHNCAISRGRLYCWGDNEYGQLGNGTTVDSLAPVRAGTATDWHSLSAGGVNTCAIRGGALYCWSFNRHGQLGNGTTSADMVGREPAQVGTDTDWQSFSMGDTHVCGIRAGRVYCWGNNDRSQLGDGTIASKSVPTQTVPETDWQSISAGVVNTCGIRAGGALYCWGMPRPAAAPVGSPPLEPAGSRVPVKFGDFEDWDAVATGGSNGDFCATRNGALYCWRPAASKVSTQMGTATDWQSVTMGSAHGCGIRNGRLYCWGSNSDGQFGDGTNVSAAEPAQVGGFADWEAVEAGNYSTCGIRSGQVYCWGRGDPRNPAPNPPAAVSVPTRVGSADDWESLGAGGMFHSCGIRAGRLFCWGNMAYGKLGNGVDLSNSNQLTPAPIGPDVDWQSVDLGPTHTCGIRSGGLYCWGRNFDGELGIGEAGAPRTTPVQVGTAADWQHVAAGGRHTCGIRARALYCWGSNWTGQLGVPWPPENGPSPAITGIDYVTVPQVVTAVGGSEVWTAVAAGVSHTCGIRELQFPAGAVYLYCWGLLTDREYFRPRELDTGGFWTSVSAATDHSCGISGDLAFCWGANGAGELGNGTRSPSHLPSLVSTVDGEPWQAISAGDNHTCGIRSGSLYCWGSNASGQVGDGTFNDTALAVRIGSATDWENVASGDNHTCAIRGGSLYCWGSNVAGQSGIGRPSWSPAPVLLPE